LYHQRHYPNLQISLLNSFQVCFVVEIQPRKMCCNCVNSIPEIMSLKNSRGYGNNTILNWFVSSQAWSKLVDFTIELLPSLFCWGDTAKNVRQLLWNLPKIMSLKNSSGYGNNPIVNWFASSQAWSKLVDFTIELLPSLFCCGDTAKNVRQLL
jgi:hypothetical protein